MNMRIWLVSALAVLASVSVNVPAPAQGSDRPVVYEAYCGDEGGRGIIEVNLPDYSDAIGILFVPLHPHYPPSLRECGLYVPKLCSMVEQMVESSGWPPIAGIHFFSHDQVGYFPCFSSRRVVAPAGLRLD